MPRERDPFPFPKRENDNTFTGTKTQQKPPFDKPTHIAQDDQPWSRLNNRPTLASIRRNFMYYDRQAPNDSLDFHLKSTYDHHQEFLRRKNETLFQRETITEDHGRTLKNRGKCEAATTNDTEADAKVWTKAPKNSIYSIGGIIESHHNASTNGGYSRKHDGGFYST